MMNGKSKGYTGSSSEFAAGNGPESERSQTAENLRGVEQKEFWVDDWIIDPSTDRMTHGEEAIKLEPKVMSLLVYLAGLVSPQ